ncbi:MAG: endonuclease III domain-containing protein [Planctomycetes bacterium]|nr:endonuclease III domain-containing protein [Planctomycetota bacterium]
MSRTGKTLMDMYAAMRERFAHQRWWPGETQLEICVGAILTQNTNWTNVEKAIANLKAAGRLSLPALAKIGHDELAGLIRPAGYFNVKAKRLKNFITHVWRQVGDDLPAFLDRSAGELREELLGINGVGRETADSIVLYAAGKLSFVVDAYTARIMLRHGLLCPEDDYEAIKEFFESNLADDLDLWNDYHAQLVAVGKNYCKPRPACDGCPLEKFPHDIRAGLMD